jgi:hypothetical protein
MLTFKESIAGAVAREINRIAAGVQPADQQGAAYKAAWDRAGSSALKHCQDSSNDVARVGQLAYAHELRAFDHSSAARDYAVFESLRGPERRGFRPDGVR